MKNKTRYTGILLSALAISGAAQAANIPGWWHTRGLVNTNLVSNDYAPANVGQLKQVAYQTWVEMTNQLAQLAINPNETDPQVGANSMNYLPKWNGSALVSGIIYDNGNIGIGTTSPQTTLDVNGTIHCGWPDFVLGKYDGRSQGSNLGNRALVHGSVDELILNYAGDFEGGVRIGGPSLSVGTGTATGLYAVAEGYNTTAGGIYAHAEGYISVASGWGSHAEGSWNTASGVDSHAEGEGTEASGGFCNHAQGFRSRAIGETSHAEGRETTASGTNCHAEGWGTTASGNGSHAEGWVTTASGNGSHAAGYRAKAIHDNTYVWSDGTDISSTAASQYTVYAANGTRLLGGNVGIGTANPVAKLDVGGSLAINGQSVINTLGQWVGSPTGLQGPQGATGPQGPKGLNWLGTWYSGTSYAANDAIQYNGSAWVAKRSNINSTPVEGADWTLLAAKGATGAQGATGATGAQGPTGATGATGPQGPAGPAVHTSAVCSSASGYNSGSCDCGVGRLLFTVASSSSTVGCTVTSDTGSCTAYGVAGPLPGQAYVGACCVCAPN